MSSMGATGKATSSGGAGRYRRDRGASGSIASLAAVVGSRFRAGEIQAHAQTGPVLIARASLRTTRLKWAKPCSWAVASIRRTTP